MMSSTPNELNSLSSVYCLCRSGDVQDLERLLMSQPALTGMEDPVQKWTPIHWAAYYGQLDCMRQVAFLDPTVIHAQSSGTFQTPLHCAAAGGHVNCLLWLLEAGTNPEVKDNAGETALHKAARTGDFRCINLLLQVTSNISSQNTSGQTASVVAEYSGHSTIAACIRDAELRGSAVRFTARVFGRCRKRTRDAVCEDDIPKRLRTDDGEPDVEDISRIMNSSVMDHESLYNLDLGYRNTLLECMLSEYHGC